MPDPSLPNANLPLRALVAFEASARLGSFRAAAEELGLTPSAVSHQIRQLEAGSGVRLFDRVGRGVLLSDDGREFFESLREGFRILRNATAALSRRRSSGRKAEVVRLQTPPSFAGRWLLPRLAGLLERHPTLDLQVRAEGAGGFDASRADLAIVYGDARHWRPRALPLLEERIQPLCAPALARAIPSARALLSLPLIATRVNLVSWRDWLRGHGLALSDSGARIIELDPSDVAIEAATKGLGVILESDLLAESELADGRLVAPLGDSAVSSLSYWLVPATAPDRPAVEWVRRWLLATAGAASVGSPPR